MTLTADNVRVGVTGGIYFAPISTTLPTDTETALNVAFVEVGYISDDGVTQSISTDVNEIKAWQNGDTVRKVQTSHDVTYAFTMIESSAAALTAYYGNYSSGVVEITGDQLDHQAMVLEVEDGDHVIRIALPDAQITDRGDVVYQNGEEVGYPVTVTAYPDSSGVKAYMYIDVAAP